MFKIKIEEISISYNVIYKLVYNKDNKKFVTTSEVDYYKVEICNLNLKGTKLISQGYWYKIRFIDENSRIYNKIYLKILS